MEISRYAIYCRKKVAFIKKKINILGEQKYD